MAKPKPKQVNKQFDPKKAHACVKNKQKYSEDGVYEIPCDKPVEMPMSFKRPQTLAEKIRELYKNERIMAELDAAGYETPEEADDFVCDDDLDPSSPYEHDFDHLEPQPHVAKGMVEESPNDAPEKVNAGAQSAPAKNTKPSEES